jgi:nitrite reductase/ring-hydroxylating ferredoxin subunit
MLVLLCKIKKRPESMNFFRSILFFSIILYTVSCDRGKEENPIPYVPVNIIIYVSDPSFMPLNVISGWTYVTGGSRGVLIYRRAEDEFMAYDRHCTFDVDNPCGQIKIANSSLSAIDTCCGSKFLITDGSVMQAPAKVPLHRYRTFYDGVKLTITN